MPNSGVNVVFFGTEEFSLVALRSLVEAGYTVAAVITKPDQPSGRGMRLREPTVKVYAVEHGIRVLQPSKMSQCHAELSAIPDRIGVLSSFGKIVPQSTLDLFEHGIINIHPSLLPQYRGPSPIETALYDGHKKTGVSIMRLVARMDAGPVYAQKEIAIADDTSASSLYTICAQAGSDLLLSVLPQIINQALTAIEQSDEFASYTSLLNTKDSLVDPKHMSAAEIERHIRAYDLYPRTKMTVAGHTIIILAARVADDSAGLVVECAGDTRLTIDELIAPSGKKMTAAAFRNGYAR